MMMEKISIPDIGEASDVEVIEVLVKPGDHVEKDDSLVVLESDKASMEIPSPLEGTIDSIEVKVGDKVDEGDLILILSTDASPSPGEQDAEVEQDAGVESSAQESTPVDAASSVVGDAENVAEVAAEPVVSLPPKPVVSSEELPETDAAKAKVHAGPSVRKQAREYGVDLGAIKGSGKLGRIVKEDVVAFVKIELTKQLSGGAGIPALPEVDFTKFGEVEAVPLSRIRQASARNLHRSWLNVPHVTQFDQADVTDLELFRKAQNVELADSGLKMTPLVFFIRAVVSGLQKYPQFNASLDPEGKNLLYKKYINIGIAVETEDGLVVPVIKDADKKGLLVLAEETAELAKKARGKSLNIDALQGATFTISSLGGIGGTAFTPIVNAPEVAILGVSRTRVEAVYDGAEFVPRTILPLSLSYDHRAIDGAEAARFANHLSEVLSDTRLMLL